MTLYLALNEEVLEELRGSLTLCAVWLSTGGTIDSDIDPMHNPDWVEQQKKSEAQRLLTCKNLLEKHWRLWSSLHPGRKQLYTDYPIEAFGDKLQQSASIRRCHVARFHKDSKYLTLVVHDTEDGGDPTDWCTVNIKRGYVYSEYGCCGGVPPATTEELRLSLQYNTGLRSQGM